jgi:hypothetical protein
LNWRSQFEELLKLEVGGVLIVEEVEEVHQNLVETV